MRIAFTGASSTGKTTLAKHVLKDLRLKSHPLSFITANARGLLQDLGYSGIDDLTTSERRNFQWQYLRRKNAGEDQKTDYFTDRSFVDVAAYWLEYNGLPSDHEDRFVAECRKQSVRYDLHLYFPHDLIPLVEDGFRSVDGTSRARTAVLIQALLQEWGVSTVVLSELDLLGRADVFFRASEPHA